MSQKDCESKVIDGAKYSVYMLPPKMSRRILVKIIKVIAPAFGGVVDADSLTDISGDSIGSALTSVADRLDDDDLDWMMDELSKVTQVHAGDKAPFLSTIFDIHFKGKMGAMFAWFGFALKVQYGNFWSVWGDGSAPDFQAILAGLGSGSPSTSIGKGGDSPSTE